MRRPRDAPHVEGTQVADNDLGYIGVCSDKGPSIPTNYLAVSARLTIVTETTVQFLNFAPLSC